MNDLHNLFNAPQVARWDGPTLFISSSLDMRHVRQDICAALKGFLARTDTEVPLQLWEWESSVEERPYDQRLARQDDLGRPSHRLVAGTVCLLGERIGHPERGFDPATLPNWVDWSDPARPFRAQHPWPEAMAEQLAAVRAGAFPVSGTVFEALDALSTGRPVYITYFADSSVLRGDATKPLLNGQVWRNKQLTQLADDEAQNWLATEYTLQTTAVTNFLRALSVRDRHVPFHRDKFAALESIQRFVLQHFGPTQARLGNPYRFLDYYDVLDHADLVGHEDLSRQAADLIRARAHNPGTQAISLRLTGESGCGKTSFMRAGVLGALISAGDQGRFRVLAVRPTDFHDHSGQPDRGVIRTLLGIVAREFSDLTIQVSELERLSRAGQRAPQLAVDALVRALGARDDAATRKFFVLGLDQFEEIVDDLAALERRPHARNWLPLLRFVELASQTDRFALVFTLESSRREAFGRLADRLPLTLREAVDIPLGSPSDAFLERMILRPFQRAGYRLAPAVVDALISGYRRYDGSTRRHASSLPLLALKLSNLFDHVHALRGPTRAERDRPGVQFEESKDVGADELGSVLSFDNDIEELATSAWTERQKNESDQLNSLDGLLQPLVALSGDDLEEITLQTVGNNVFVNASQQLDAFEQVRLVVRENGRRRLVHEAVVRQWPLAAKWLAQERAYLIDEATLRTHANAWVLKGRDQALLPTDLASIALAATVLRHYRSAWPGTPGEDLPKRDQALREHCLAVFAKSEDPNVSDGDRFDSHWHHAHVAAIYGLTEVLERYIAREPQCVQLLTGGKRTPLHMAAWSTRTGVRLLLAHGADPCAKDSDGWTPMAGAVWQRDREIFSELAPHYRTPSHMAAPGGMSLLHVAARRGAVEIAAALMQTIGDLDPLAIDDNGWSPIDFAAAFDQVEAFRYFLRFQDHVCYEPGGRTNVLHVAAGNGAIRVVEEILSDAAFDRLVDAPDAAGMTPLMLAAQMRHESTVRRLLQAADPNLVQGEGARQGWTALHYAIKGPDDLTRETRTTRQRAVRTVQALLEVEAILPMACAKDGGTPWSLAAGLPQVRDRLLRHPGFRHNERLQNGTTPLNHVIAQGDRPAVERLLAIPDIDVELLDGNGGYSFALMLDKQLPDIASELLAQRRFRPWDVEGARSNGLREAVQLPDLSLADQLLEMAPAETSAEQRSHVTAAARVALLLHRPLPLLLKLIKLGAIVPDSTPRQLSLFHIAAMTGYLAAFDLLTSFVEWGPALRTTFDRTPADLAPEALQAAFRERERQAPSPPSPPLAEGNDAVPEDKTVPPSLFSLARLGDLAGFEQLLQDPNTDPEITDSWGRTPVDMAPDSVVDAFATVLAAARRLRRP